MRRSVGVCLISVKEYREEGKLKRASLLTRIICCLDILGARVVDSTESLGEQSREMSRLYRAGCLHQG